MTFCPWKENNVMAELPEFDRCIVEILDEEETRCPYCGRLLFRGHLGEGSEIEMKCARRECRRVFTLVKPRSAKEPQSKSKE